ncbi:hypothetical protein [Rhodopirellula sp. MGV]|uniref:hypothetical protein n=1 Tax=Rhodopirellula sp. MGV TaxID=2023130 RepID=UPI000B970BE8|nr:hypothetical protein [Rhodopirellula sp. MGV]OYP28478.1 hypothetical protein CGZ80_27140 [Rhodopirellula sp. MGV]PNY38644.1 hypothetical protein C2E31_01630 [Rhodopirellula baltica]
MRSKQKNEGGIFTVLLDLTFNMVGTLGVGLLMMILILVLVMAALSNAEEENRGLHRTIGGLETRIKRLSGRPLTLVVCIDISASMDDEIRALTAAIDATSVFLPVSSTRFELSILAFRKGTVAKLPLMEIKKGEIDGGRSREQAIDFVKSLSAESSPTEHRSVAREAYREFQRADPEFAKDRRELWVWIGDVFTAELDSDFESYSDAERHEAKSIVAAIKRWANTGGDRRVLAFFSEKSEAKTSAVTEESRAWFKALGEVNDRSVFETEISRLLVAIKTAVLTEDSDD